MIPRNLVVVAFVSLCFLALPSDAHTPPLSTEAPPDAFCIVVIEPLDGFNEVRVTVDENLSAAAKQSAWDSADVDGDGIVSSEEGDAFRQETLKFWPGGLEMGNRSLYLGAWAPDIAITDVRPVYAATWRHLGHGFYDAPVSTHTGLPPSSPVNFEQFETQAVRLYGFHVAANAQTIILAGAQPAPIGQLDTEPRSHTYEPCKNCVIEYVVVLAPDGWIVDSVTGYSYEGQFSRNGGSERLELSGFDTSSPWSIQFSKRVDGEVHSSGASPGFQAIGLLGVCVLAALVARSRGEP